jgi:hypothetical protein
MGRSEDAKSEEDPGCKTPTCPLGPDETAVQDRLRLVPTAFGLGERLAGRLDEHLARFADHLREGLLAASVAVGLDVMAELMAAEVTELAGPKGKHNPARTAMRHGSEQGTAQPPVNPGRFSLPRGSAAAGPPPQGPHRRRRRARAHPGVL